MYLQCHLGEANLRCIYLGSVFDALLEALKKDIESSTIKIGTASPSQ